MMKSLKICVLQSSYENSNAPFKDFDPYCDPESFYPKDNRPHTFDRVLLGKATASQQIRDLAMKGDYDVYINLCDGAADEDRAGMEVTQLLEKYNLAYTGGDPNFYEPSKEVQKMMAYYYGVRTPAFTFAYNDEDIEDAHERLQYPMIVKHYNGYSSIGMTKRSRVTNREELYELARDMIEKYEGALIEEFVDGREFTVLVAENPDDENNPLAFNPVECVFKNGESFKHFDLKWKEYQNISWAPCKAEESELNEQMKEMTKKVFVALKGVSYARADLRVNEKGEAYFLEINPNCGIFYPAPPDDPTALGSADFILIHDKFGHVRFTEHIINCAIRRRNRKQPIASVRFKWGMGYGYYAARDIEIGEVVWKKEEREHFLVSKEYVEREWKDPLKKKWFEQYAYPETENVFNIWSENPLEWKPINHSCDPNSWLIGLDLVSKRRIRKGEEITTEYATFCADNMESFECRCNSSQCRGVITGTDYLKPFVEKYSNHVSDYVESKRKVRNQNIQ